MPKVIYDQINGDTLLYTNMCLQLADQSLCYPRGVLEDAIVRVGQSYVRLGLEGGKPNHPQSSTIF